MTEPSPRRQLSALVDGPESDIDLARACLLVACEEYPALDVGGYLGRIDAMAEILRGRLRGSPAAAVDALNRVLFEEEGFRGNVREYYDPRNSFLNDVLDRRTGIPITLSTVYIAVGRRAGISVDGVGLPGHFLVRVTTAAGNALVDPFHLGTVLTEKDCQDRLDRIYGGRVRLGPQMLAPCPPRAMLTRVVRNLEAIYVKEEDAERALWAADLLVLLNPGVAEEVRDRGLLLAGLECYALAARDLEAYVAMAPHAPGTDHLRARTVELRRKASRPN
ncbi:MAG TPA: tetratricopeptide repeat protein [Vicinamibacteria bacterium]|nr:tetratricopeptide repeat protein [Vicinamibacteria bacterium]